MVRQRALAGALVLLASAHRAIARADIWESDVVALVQFAASALGDKAADLVKQAADVEQSLTSLLDGRRRAQRLSLLAVNASRAARWYDMDDTALLRKLHDRMKANEEKEQVQIANAQSIAESGVPNATAFLDEAATSKGSRFDAAHWLTQSDLDHYAEDERRLQQLGSELQRVAASMARIASHQREMGAHLGLPDPSKVKFEPGEKIEVMVGEGKNGGSWTKAIVIGPGDRLNTWNVHIPSSKKGKQDLASVPAVSLRKDEDANEKVFDPSEVKYAVDESAQVQIAVGPQSGQWVRCVIRSKADLPDTYNILIPSAPAGHREVPSVPSRVLRKAESKALFKQYDLDGNGQLSTEEFQIAVREKATTVYEEKALVSKQLFQDGEQVEFFTMEGEYRGLWVNSTVMGMGDLANTWNIFLPGARPGYEYVSNIPTKRLRKVGQHKTAAEAAGHPIRVIPPEADHEVLLNSGDYKGWWVPCSLRRKSDAGDSHTIFVPFGAPDGRSVIPNVEPDRLRPRRVCGEGYEDIFDADSPGWDHYDRQFNHKESAEACAADCSKRFSCGSFEWSPTIKECHLNRVADPSLPGNGDYLFCRRSKLPKSPGELWRGPWIGQELEFFTDTGNHTGTWQRCNITGYGQKPDTYNFSAFVSVPGRPPRLQHWSAVPLTHLRYLKGEMVPPLFETWEPPEGKDALYSLRVLKNTTLPTNSTTLVAQASSTNASVGNVSAAEVKLAALPEAAAIMKLKSAKVSQAPSERADQAAELEAEAEEELQASEDLGQDLPEGFFRQGQLAEVKQVDSWVRCHVLKQGSLPRTFNLRLLTETNASKDLTNIPVLAMRKVQTAQADRNVLDAHGIDGDVGEKVEVLVAKGPHAGEWVPALVKGHGSNPDTYDVMVLGLNGTKKLVKNVKGAALRRIGKKVIVEDELDWPLFSVGEQAMVSVPMGRSTLMNYSCTIKAKAAVKNTYDLEVPSFGDFPAAHARLLRKFSKKEALRAAKEDKEEVAISLKGFMKVIQGIKSDLLPVVDRIVASKKDLRVWFRRFTDWDLGCEEEDLQRLVAKLKEASAKSPETLKAAVPEECSLAQWTPKDRRGVAWDNVATCLQIASNTSRACSGCPVKFFASAADRCVAKCTAMMTACAEERQQEKGACSWAAGRCLDCLQGPLEDLLECTAVPERLGIMGAVAQMVKGSKGSEGLKVEANLRESLQVANFLHIDKFARQLLRSLLFTWGTISSKREL